MNDIWKLELKKISASWRRHLGLLHWLHLKAETIKDVQGTHHHCTMHRLHADAVLRRSRLSDDRLDFPLHQIRQPVGRRRFSCHDEM
jgi:hypothetical protein